MNVSALKDYVAVPSGLLAPVIAAVAAYIAWQQRRNARTKLRLDLYERRLTVYRGLVDFSGSGSR